MKRTRTRALATAPVALLVLTLLMGCSPADQGGGTDADGCALPGNKSDAVRVTGDFGTELKLDSRVSTQSFQRTVMQSGDGAPVEVGSWFVGKLNIFVGESGNVYTQEESRFVMSSERLAPWYYSMVNCASEGDRIASVMPAVDLLGPGGGGGEIADDDTLVAVLDLGAVLSPGAGRAVGAEQALPAGFPGLAVDANGVPSIVDAAGAAPGASVRFAARIVGEGPVVEPGQTVLAHYRSVVARTGTVLDDTWAATALAFPVDQALPGLAEGLTGQTVGSQVVVMVPSAGGYQPDELGSRGMQPDDIVVYVIDILDAG